MPKKAWLERKRVANASHLLILSETSPGRNGSRAWNAPLRLLSGRLFGSRALAKQVSFVLLLRFTATLYLLQILELTVPNTKMMSLGPGQLRTFKTSHIHIPHG